MDSLEALKNIAYGLGNKKEDYEYEFNVISNELKVLNELRNCILNMPQCYKKREKQMHIITFSEYNKLLEYTVDEFFKEFGDELSARARNNLKRNFDVINKDCRDCIKIDYYDDTMKKFLSINPNRLYDIRNLGKKSVKEIINMLESHGLYFNYYEK